MNLSVDSAVLNSELSLVTNEDVATLIRTSNKNNSANNPCNVNVLGDVIIFTTFASCFTNMINRSFEMVSFPKKRSLLASGLL